MKTPLSLSLITGFLWPKKLAPLFLFTAFVGAAFSPGAYAAERFWYGDSTSCVEDSGGRNGIWNTTATSWKTDNDGVCPGDATWVAGDDAVFTSGGSATVLIRDANPSAARVWVKTGGFLFMATAANRTLTLTSGRFTVDSGAVTVGRSLVDPAHNMIITVPSPTPFILDGAGRFFGRVSSAGFRLNADKILISGGGTYHFNTGEGWGNTVPATYMADYITISNNSTLRIETITSGGPNRGITIGDGGGNILNGANNTISAPLTGISTLTKSGAGILTLSADNSTFTGKTKISAATLAITNGLAIADDATVEIDNVSGAILRVDASETIGQLVGGGTTGGSVTLNGAEVVLTVGNAGDFAYGGNITGAGSLAKTGAGKMTLTRDTTFAGGTTVSAGTLLVNNTTGSGTGTGAVTVGPLGTLGGTGTIGGAVSVSGTVSAGASAGLLTLQNGLALEAGATNIWELTDLKDNTDGVAGTDFSQIILTGGELNINPGATLLLRFSGGASEPDSDPFWSASRSWTIIQLNGGANSANAAFASIANGSYSAGNFSTASDGNGNIVLTFTPGAPSAPQITAHPQSQTRIVGTTASFTVQATGTPPLTYEWFRTDNQFTPIPGATQATFTITNVQAANVGSYFARVYGIGSATSQTASLSLAPLPTLQPLAVTAGGTQVVAVWNSVSGTEYQLQYNTNLATTNWQLATNIVGSGGSLSVTNFPPAGDPQRYFRLLVP